MQHHPLIPINSEIKKYCWQDFSLQRLIAMPAVLLAIPFLIGLSDPQAIVDYASQAYFILVFIWGGYRAANAIGEEIRDNTWDNIRLSAVSAWQLALGKLFGSTLYSWYGGLIALLIHILAAQAAQWQAAVIFYSSLLLLMSGLFCQAIAMLISAQAVCTQTRYRKHQSIIYHIVGIISGAAFYSLGQVVITPIQHGIITTEHLQWYTIEIASNDFIPISLSIFLLWPIIGIYRSMREVLKLKNMPWVLSLFISFLMCYIAGFSAENIALASENTVFAYIQHLLTQSRLTTAFIIGIFSCYLMLFVDVLNITRYRILWHQWRNRAWRDLLQTTPIWLIALTLSMIVAIPLVIFGQKTECIFVFAVLLFLLRDTLILHCFTFNTNPQRAALATLFYWAVLYILLPLMLFTATPDYPGTIIFYPAINSQTLSDLIPIIIQTVLVAWLLRSRYQKTNKTINAINE